VMPTIESARPRAHAISVADGRNETMRGMREVYQKTRTLHLLHTEAARRIYDII